MTTKGGAIMQHWAVGKPTTIEFDSVSQLRVRLIAGAVAVIATDEAPSLTVSSIAGHPLQVSNDAGVLTIGYEDLTWDSLLEWLRPKRHSADITVTVPEHCPIQLGVVNASAVVSGLAAGAAVKSVSGEITFDGLTGDIKAQTVSGTLLARDLDGSVRFNSVSGSLTLAGGELTELNAETVNGDVAADVALTRPADVHVATVSGEVTLRVPSDTDARVRLRSASGKVRSEFDALRAAASPGPHNVSGNLGAGSGNISASTVSGAITLLRLAPSGTMQRAGVKMESETR